MSEIRADVLAADLLRRGKTVDEVLEATGLERREVLEIASKLNRRPVSAPAAASHLAAGGPVKSDPLGWIKSYRDAVADAAGKPLWAPATRRALQRAVDALDKAAAAQEEDAGKAAIRAEIARLKAQTKRLEEQLRGEKPSKPTAKSRDLKVVRAWAREHGMDVSDVGRVPAEVVDAYEAAQAAS